MRSACGVDVKPKFQLSFKEEIGSVGRHPTEHNRSDNRTGAAQTLEKQFPNTTVALFAAT